MIFKTQKNYRIGKCRTLARQYFSSFKKRKKKLAPDTIKEFETNFKSLDEALLRDDVEESNVLLRKIELLSDQHLQKNLFDYGFELLLALAFALIIATIVRQMWFELYEIPTGSMRPTFEEQDRLTVSKTSFGINVPFTTSHFYFDPDLVQRGGVIIFSGENIDLPDTDTKYFWLFPAKKRYIKRLIGKPGDSLYFYGGKIYGVDKAGNAIADFEHAPWSEKLEHIPFLTFDGKAEGVDRNQIIFKQMNLPLARIINDSYKGPVEQLKIDGKWKAADSEKMTYADFFGLRNFAMARLLTLKQAKELGYPEESLKDGVLYLELAHHPGLTQPPANLDPQSLRNGYIVGTEKSLIPLGKKEIDALMKNMYTARFVVRNNHATRYSADSAHFSSWSPDFKGVPDGTYEFYYGKGKKVGWGGILYDLPTDQPLYNDSPENIQRLYNYGIDFLTAKLPGVNNKNNFPHRYAYFREGDLYLMGVPVIRKGDPLLVNFEKEEEAKAGKDVSYKPFKDYGPPVDESGHLNRDFIRTYGVTIPDGKYLVLGDNHAMSADSRVFGFVPEGNLEGTPCFILWPPGERMGPPLQKAYPLLTIPRLLIWGIAGAVFLILYLLYRRRAKRSFYKD